MRPCYWNRALRSIRSANIDKTILIAILNFFSSTFRRTLFPIIVPIKPLKIIRPIRERYGLKEKPSVAKTITLRQCCMTMQAALLATNEVRGRSSAFNNANTNGPVAPTNIVSILDNVPPITNVTSSFDLLVNFGPHTE